MLYILLNAKLGKFNGYEIHKMQYTPLRASNSAKLALARGHSCGQELYIGCIRLSVKH